MRAKLLTLRPQATPDRSDSEARHALRRWRCARDWTQERAAGELELSTKTLARYEAGERAVPWRVLRRAGIAVLVEERREAA